MGKAPAGGEGDKWPQVAEPQNRHVEGEAGQTSLAMIEGPTGQACCELLRPLGA